MKIKKIILVQHTHTDIGYTTNYPRIAVRHNRHMRDVLAECRKDPRFRWTIETGWTLEQFLAVADEEEKKDLATFLRNGQLELTGFYNQPLTQIADLEELCCCVERSHEILREVVKDDAVKITTAMINDIGGLSYNIPQILSHYGPRNIVNGCGGWRVMTPYTTLPHLFYLVGPDGSKVLFYQIGDDRENRQDDLGPAQYGFGVIYFLWPLGKEINAQGALTGDDGEKTIFNIRGREGIDMLLARLHRDKYPCDTLLIQLATDNYGPWPGVLEAIDYWNDKYKDPEIQLGTCEEFFRDVETRFGKQLAVIQGELTCSWSEHLVTYGSATGHYRDARRRLTDWSSLQACRGNPSDEDAAAWSNVMEQFLLYSDHTCGISMWKWDELVRSYGSIRDDAFDVPRRAWSIKSDYALKATRDTLALQDRQAIQLSRDDPDAPKSITVFNPNSFTADGGITFTSAQPRLALRGAGGEAIPVDSRPINTKLFQHKAWCRSIPPYGTMMFDVIDPVSEQPKFTCDGWMMRGPMMTIRVDPNTGGVCSAKNVSTNVEWVNTAEYTLNEVVYFDIDGVEMTPKHGGLAESYTMDRAKITAVSRKATRDGVHGASMMVEIHLSGKEGDFTVETQYTLDASGLGIRNFVRKLPTLEKEACHFAFPLRLDAPFRFDIEHEGQTTRFPEERLPGSTNHDLGMQDFLAVSDSARHAVLTTKQACVVSLGRPDRYHYDLDYHEIETPTVLFYAFNNLWNTNCPLHQTGDLVYEFHVAFEDRPFAADAAYRISRSVTHPPVVIPGNLEEIGFRRDGANLFTRDAENVIVESVRPLGRNEWQFRFIEVNRKPTKATLELVPGRFRRFAERKDSLTPPRWQSIEKDKITLEFRPAEMKTILLES
ncbi:MAG: hypothetical protein JXA11_10685 [Phycisphaerae bacterium]|nr:hypothetical protein [Phycisphaerae bacterium]